MARGKTMREAEDNVANIDETELAIKLKDLNSLAMKELVDRNSMLTLERRKRRRDVRKTWSEIEKDQMALASREITRLSKKSSSQPDA